MSTGEPATKIAFKDLGLAAGIQQAIDELGFDEPTPIQEQAIPELLGGHDVIGQAQTGTGKTAAFGLPLLQYLDPANEEVQAPSISTSRSSPSSAAPRSASSSRSCAPAPTSSSPPSGG